MGCRDFYVFRGCSFVGLSLALLLSSSAIIGFIIFLKVTFAHYTVWPAQSTHRVYLVNLKIVYKFIYCLLV